jgi:hypothetical protein
MYGLYGAYVLYLLRWGGMKLFDVFDLFPCPKCGNTQKFWVKAVDGREGWIPQTGLDDDFPFADNLVDALRDMEVEVEYVWCTFCQTFIYERGRFEELKRGD